MLKFLLLMSLVATALAALVSQPRYLEDFPGRVVGGNVAKPNSWPWQVSLQYRSGIRWSHTCGGSLIEPGWVMTAAHCVDSPGRTYRVAVGDHDINVVADTEQFISVSQIHIHPGWDPSNVGGGDDIALLRLNSNAVLTPEVQLASLPPSGHILPHSNLCFITGWGRTSTSGPLSSVLKQAYLPVVGHATCSTDSWWGSSLKTTMVCAGGGAESGCNGDSGGPLNCFVNGKYHVHGIASFVSRFGCNHPKKPTVFTRVSAFIEWMDSIKAEKSH